MVNGTRPSPTIFAYYKQPANWMVGRPRNEARYKVDGTKLENEELFLEFDCYVSSSHSRMLIKQKNYTSNGWLSMTREWKQ